MMTPRCRPLHQPQEVHLPHQYGGISWIYSVPRRIMHGPSESLNDPSMASVGRIIVPSINRLWSPVWRLSACLESGTIYNILFNMQNPSKILLKLKLGNSKVLQVTSKT